MSLFRKHVWERKVATRWRSSPSFYNGSFKQIFPWQQWFDSSHHIWNFYFLVLCRRCGPTWYLRTSSCSFKTCISCLGSPKPSTWVVLLWASSCCSASGLPEAEGKQGAGLYPEAWLYDRLAAPVGLLLMHDAGPWITSSSQETTNISEWYLENMKSNWRLMAAQVAGIYLFVRPAFFVRVVHSVLQQSDVFLQFLVLLQLLH